VWDYPETGGNAAHTVTQDSPARELRMMIELLEISTGRCLMALDALGETLDADGAEPWEEE